MSLTDGNMRAEEDALERAYQRFLCDHFGRDAEAIAAFESIEPGVTRLNIVATTPCHKHGVPAGKPCMERSSACIKREIDWARATAERARQARAA